jgi:hypothetical protein
MVLLGTAAGAWRAASMAASKPAPSTLVVSGVSYQVTHAEQVLGLSSSDLAGMSHGIQGLVTNDKALVRVTLVISAGDSPVSYDVTVLRAFAKGSARPIVPVGGTLTPGRLSAHARIEGSVSFVVPRNGAQLALRGVGDSREVALLQVDNNPAGPDKHHGSASSPAASPAASKSPLKSR